jgi:nicotinamide riboside transporter PnuC
MYNRTITSLLPLTVVTGYLGWYYTAGVSGVAIASGMLAGMQPMDMLQALSVLLGLTGTWLINRKQITGYYFWLVSNTMAVPVLWHAHLWWMTALFSIYFILSLDGLREWRQHSTGGPAY